MRLDCKKWHFSQSQVSLEEQPDCIKAFQAGFVSLVLEAKPLISDESVCLQCDEENIFYLFTFGRIIFEYLFLSKPIFQSVQWIIIAINKSYKQSSEPIWDLVGFYFLLTLPFLSVPAEQQMEKVTYSLLKLENCNR